MSLSEAKMIPDRIEAFSYLIGFLVTGGSGVIENFPSEVMGVALKVLKETGADFSINGDSVSVKTTKSFKPFVISTAPYPGFPTDMQSPMSLIAALADGESTITEELFENRLAYIKQLQSMGLHAKMVNTHEVKIKGPVQLKAQEIEALDLRSGITLVLAALQAKGKSIIDKGEIIDRGYENLIGKLTNLGAEIRRYD